MRAFLATAEHGSLSGAARALHLTQPTLSRQISALEDALGLMLFERVGRGLQLTQAGREILPHIREMGAAAEKAAITAQGQAQSVAGDVRVTASDIYSLHFMPSVIKTLRARAPKLRIDVVAANDIRDLMRREADVAVRHVRPEQPELVARLIREGEAHVYAAPSYLAERPAPACLADLSSHDFIAFGDIAENIAFLAEMGVTVSNANFRAGSENGIVAWEMVCNGLGVGIMDAAIAARHSKMVRLFPQEPAITFPVWLTTHREIHTSPRIRLVFDVLAETFGA